MVLGTVLAFLQVGGAEFILIALVALVVLGPERLPIALRKVGQAVGQVRSLSDGFRREVQSAMDEVSEPVRSMTRPQLTALDGGAATFSAAPQGTAVDDAAATDDAEPVSAELPSEFESAGESAAPETGDDVDMAAPPLVSDSVPKPTPMSDGAADHADPADGAPSTNGHASNGQTVNGHTVPDSGEAAVDKAPAKPRAPRKATAAGTTSATQPAVRKPATRKPAAAKSADAAPQSTPKPRAPRKPRPQPDAAAAERPLVDAPSPVAPIDATDAERPDDGADA